jgi:hypothetical protein
VLLGLLEGLVRGKAVVDLDRGRVRDHIARGAPQGLAAHSGRAWRGDNAIHKLADVLSVLADYEPATSAAGPARGSCPGQSGS